FMGEGYGVQLLAQAVPSVSQALEADLRLGHIERFKPLERRLPRPQGEDLFFGLLHLPLERLSLGPYTLGPLAHVLCFGTLVPLGQSGMPLDQLLHVANGYAKSRLG